MPSSGRLIKILVGIAISAGLLVYLFWDADLPAIGARLAETQWGFLAASIALNFLSLYARAARWHYLFPPGSRPSHLFNAMMIGYMGNNLLPLRAGEIVRVYVAARRGQRFWTVVATVVVERVMDGLAICLMLAGVFLLVPVPRELRWAALLFLGVDLALIAILATVAAAPDRCRGFTERLFSRWPWIRDRLLDLLEMLTEGLSGVQTPRHLFPIIGWSAAIWILLALSVWVGFHAAHLDLPLLAAWTMVAFLGLGVSLPSSPGFAGIIQAGTVIALAPFGVPRTEALSFSLLFHASQFLPVTACGLALLLVEQVSLAEATQGVRKPDARSRSRPAREL